MRILTLSNCYPPHYYGGYELTCWDVMRRFRDAGHEITVLTSTEQVPGVTASDEPQVRRTLRTYWDWNAGHARLPATPWGRYAIERRNLAALEAAIDAARPDVVSVWHMIGLSMSLLTAVERRRLPMVVTVANDWLVDAPAYDGWARMWQRWPFPAPAQVAGVSTELPAMDRATINFVSAFTKQRAVATGRYPGAATAAVAQPGIDTADFPVGPKAQRSWSWKLLYVGRIDPAKGVETLLRSFAALPREATLSIVGGGSGPYEQKVQHLAHALSIEDRVSFDRCPRDELRERYIDADVVVFPSEWEEPFGLVPIESMACGTPVIATATGGSAEFLHHGTNCLTYLARDVDALTQAIRRLAADQPLRDRLTAGGLATARRLTIDRYAAQLLELHTYVADGARSPST